MKRLTATLLALAGLIFPALAWADSTQVQGSISHNTTWSPDHNPYLVQADVTVERGAVLTLKPGTKVYFAGETNLIVKGGLEAVGEASKAVYFSPQPGSRVWGNIYFAGSDPQHSVLTRCVIAGGRVVCVSSSPRIDQCSLYGSREAIQVGAGSSPVIIGNRITDNRVGLSLVSDSASPIVMKNVVYNNEYGFFFQDFGTPRVTGNLIYANRKYNIVNRSVKGISIPWNSYQMADSASISKTLYDGSSMAGVGLVNFTPFTPLVENREPQQLASRSPEPFLPSLSFTLAGLYTSAAGAHVPANQKVGIGNLLRVDYQFRPFMSVGINAGYAAFMSSGHASYIGQLDLVGRVTPFHVGGFEPYLLGGAGINPLYNDKTTPWAGHFHATTGLGTKFNFDSGWGMDLAGIYDFYSPMANHIDAFSVRLGVSYAIGL